MLILGVFLFLVLILVNDHRLSGLDLHWAWIFEPPYVKTSVRPAKTQISLGIRPVWSESLMCAHWVAKDSSFLHAYSEDSGETGQMPRLIWVFAGHTLILLVLSCRSSFVIVNRENVLLALTWRKKITGPHSPELVVWCHNNFSPWQSVHLSWALSHALGTELQSCKGLKFLKNQRNFLQTQIIFTEVKPDFLIWKKADSQSFWSYRQFIDDVSNTLDLMHQESFRCKISFTVNHL